MNGRWIQLKSARVEGVSDMLLSGRERQAAAVGKPSRLEQPSGGAQQAHRRGAAKAKSHHAAFSLLELMVVMGIIGLLATLGTPMFKALNQNSGVSAAARQLMDDISLARMKAINNRTTVYVVFATTNLTQAYNNFIKACPNPKDNPRAYKQFTNLISGQFSAYALMAARSVGDQPGQPTPRYLTEWRTLPEGIFIAPFKYTPMTTEDWAKVVSATNRPFAYTPLRFPTADGLTNALPYIAFNSAGQLVPPTGVAVADEIIPLVRGSIMFEKDALGRNKMSEADFRETPPGNGTNMFYRVHVFWQTGRAKVEKLEIQ
jgi:prepilin-type N-terminal cleavage/methylation domain-containing protein